MPYALTAPVIPCLSLLKRRIQQPLSIGTLGLGLLLSLTTFHPAPASAEQVNSDTFADGTYVFGERPQADQIGTTYMVVEAKDGRAIGGFYQPNSSFDCFYGDITDSRMLLTVVNSYEQTEHALSVTLEAQNQVASQGTALRQAVPRGFHVLPNLSETDHTVLQTCRGIL